MDGDESPARIVGRGIDHIDRGIRRDPGRRDVRPGLGIVPGDMDQPVIASGPEDPAGSAILEGENRPKTSTPVLSWVMGRPE